MIPPLLIGFLAIGLVSANDPWSQNNFPPPPRVGELGPLVQDHNSEEVEFDDPVKFPKIGHICLLNSSESSCVDPLQCRQIELLTLNHKANVSGQGICSSVTCSYDCANQTMLECPSDSYSYTSFINDSEGRRCCIQTCLCLPDGCNQGAPRKCESPYDYISHGSNTPGNCCDVKVCYDAPSSECNYNGSRYSHGDSWHNDQCEQCQCKYGVARCNWTDNCPLPNKCYNTEKPVSLQPNECCSPCKKCLYNNTYYKHEQEWQDTSAKCQTCQCKNSKVNCITAFCKPLQCAQDQKRIHRPDECCDSCVCELNCPDGYKSDDNGTEVCECKHQSIMASKACQDAHCDSIDKKTIAVCVGVLLAFLAIIGAISCYCSRRSTANREYKSVRSEDQMTEASTNLPSDKDTLNIDKKSTSPV